jgi:hypothetical protein
VTLDHATAGQRGGNAVRWHREPCPAQLVVVGGHRASGDPVGRTFTCQRPQKWAGDRWPGHRVHLWQGEIDGKPAELTWRAEL